MQLPLCCFFLSRKLLCYHQKNKTLQMPVKCQPPPRDGLIRGDTLRKGASCSLWDKGTSAERSRAKTLGSIQFQKVLDRMFPLFTLARLGVIIKHERLKSTTRNVPSHSCTFYMIILLLRAGIFCFTELRSVNVLVGSSE